MDEDFSAIKAGISVDIKRTDGRVHGAVVSGVNLASRCVTVEWFEHGETKGKEVEIEAILALNLHLVNGGYNNNQNNSVSNNKVPRQGSSDEDDEEISALEEIEEQQRNGNSQPSSATLPIRATPSRPYSIKAPTVVSLNKVRGTKARGLVNPTPVINTNNMNGHGEPRISENIPPTPTTPTAAMVHTRQTIAGYVQQSSMPSNVTVLGTQQQQLASKKGRQSNVSNVVKEVEKLKKNREERRQRQAEIKEEKEALMNLDPGNPNWEFLAMIREYRSGIDFRPLRDSDQVEDHQITVCVRKRPLNKKELTRKEVDVITVPGKDQMVLHEPKCKVDLTKYLENQFFRFDYAFDDTCTNETVYKYTAKPLVETIFDGGMATCFAYGQTGSGKTHTMGGDFHGKTQDCNKGIYAMVAKDVFKLLQSPKYKPLGLIVSASFFEIYSGKVFDLLADKAKLRVLEDGKNVVQIVGLTDKCVDSVDQVLKIIQHGNASRTSGQTSANSNSSRSHAVFQIVLRTAGVHKIHGKFSLIDLAGNERGADTSSANRQTRMEGAEINKSLLALKECIRALGRNSSHLPFRASKLTQVLRDSFILEKSKTCMIAMISPGMSSCEHSLNTLRYADRVKELAASDPTAESKAALGSASDEDSPVDHQRVPYHNIESFEDSDLATLRSLNEGEISAEMLTFHEAVTELQKQEDDVLDSHKALLESNPTWLERHVRLLSATREVDYDQDAYSKDLKNLLAEEMARLVSLQQKVDNFRLQLVNEEQISQKMKRPSQLPMRYNYNN